MVAQVNRERLLRWLHGLAVRSGLARLVERYLDGLKAEHKLDRRSRLLFRIRNSPAYPLLLAALSIVSAATSLYPFGPVIIAATVFAPGRWRSVIVAATLGAVAGAAAFAALAHAVGPEVVDGWFPGLRQSAVWADSAQWIGRHGVLALATITALPVPQMPALILAALGDMGLPAIILALLLGKGIKYTLYVLGVLLVLRALRRVSTLPD